MNDLNKILEKIRPNRSALFGFFSMMPKGGDLHHHYSGSIYTESYIDYIFQKDYYINETTFEVLKDIPILPVSLQVEWKKLSAVTNKDKIKLKLLRLWSNKDFVKGNESSDEHFFLTFPSFDIASKDDYLTNLKELKKRAKNQKVSYLETIFIKTDTKLIQLSNEEYFDIRFLELQKQENYTILENELEILYNQLLTQICVVADRHTKKVEKYHVDSKVEDENFKLRFQNYVTRFKQPTDVFVDLFASFHSSNNSNLICGVNIVGAENGENSMRDYWLHIQFYKFLEKKYPKVKYAIHVGELVSGMVQPENLGIHIKQSLALNNLTRIGHAVDIIYDNEFTDTIKKIIEKKIAIEINLTSNEFILGVANDMHPIEIYYRNGIPIVICTDDEGVLRTSITEQYVLLANRYKLEYTQIKEIVKNSITYSNIKENNIKVELIKQLDAEFLKFEEKIIEFYNPLFSSKEDPNKFNLMSHNIN
jgi:adenosine deaminase